MPGKVMDRHSSLNDACSRQADRPDRCKFKIVIRSLRRIAQNCVHKLPLRFAFALVVILGLVSQALPACPFCAQTGETLSEKLAGADFALVVKFLATKNGVLQGVQSTSFQVIQLMKPTEKYKVADKLEVDFGVTGEVGDTFLLMGKLVGDDVKWNLPVEIDEISREYVRQAPSPEVSPPESRLTYFSKFLDISNQLISNDAFGEFARAKFEDVDRFVALVPKDKLRTKVRKWLEGDNQNLIVRRGFYGMLLGLCGNDGDAEFLGGEILAPIDPDKFRIGYEGLMAGYIMLRGEQGLKHLVEKKLSDLPKAMDVADPRLSDANNLRFALTFLWDYRHDQFSEDVLRNAMRHFLNRPELAEEAVRDLARWKDWKSLDVLVTNYGNDPWDTRSGKEQVVAFALTCLKDAKRYPKGPASEYSTKAQSFLDGLDPDFVETVKQHGNSPIGRPPVSDQKVKKASDSKECSSLVPQIQNSPVASHGSCQTISVGCEPIRPSRMLRLARRSTSSCRRGT